jgi:hypothetical protein
LGKLETTIATVIFSKNSTIINSVTIHCPSTLSKVLARQYGVCKNALNVIHDLQEIRSFRQDKVHAQNNCDVEYKTNKALEYTISRKFKFIQRKTNFLLYKSRKDS